ncbi:OpgC domain-containing protein, partial [Salmonella enterica]
RVWQLYVAHVLLFVFYIAAIGWVAQTYNHSHLLDEFNVAGLIDHPIINLTQGLLLKFKPLNLDVLPLYIVLMAMFPPVLWLTLRQP